MLSTRVLGCAAQQLTSVVSQRPWIERLCNDAGGTEREAVLSVLFPRPRGEEDHWNVLRGRVRLQPRARARSIEFRHHPVEEDHVRGGRRDALKGFSPVGRLPRRSHPAARNAVVVRTTALHRPASAAATGTKHALQASCALVRNTEPRRGRDVPPAYSSPTIVARLNICELKVKPARLARARLTANCICPSSTNSPMTPPAGRTLVRRLRSVLTRPTRRLGSQVLPRRSPGDTAHDRVGSVHDRSPVR